MVCAAAAAVIYFELFPSAHDRPVTPKFCARCREDKYAITDEELRPYFALPNVLDGLFGLAKRLFDVDIEAADGQVGSALCMLSRGTLCLMGLSHRQGDRVRHAVGQLQCVCSREQGCGGHPVCGKPVQPSIKSSV
jgi:Peptidase family M3